MKRKGMDFDSDKVAYRTLVSDLRCNGVVVVPTPFADAAALHRLRQEFVETLHTFPEFIRSSPVDGETPNVWVRGGFAALGNPASFHNPFVRRLRQWCMALLLPVFREWKRQQGSSRSTSDWKLEQVIDRMMYRVARRKPTAESWHRDEAPLAAKHDILFGGWINLDQTDQFFSCVFGTHTAAQKGGGFATFTKAQKEQWNKSEQRRVVSIPAGHIVLFYENIVHEVVSRAQRFDSLRLFLGWRMTTSHHSLIPGLDALLDEQGVIPLKSNQIPPMWPRLNWVNTRSQLQRWSIANFRKETLQETRVESGKDAGQRYMVVHREMRSLRAYGFRLYPAYTADEKKMYRPGKRFRLLVPGRLRVYRSYVL